MNRQTILKNARTKLSPRRFDLFEIVCTNGPIDSVALREAARAKGLHWSTVRQVLALGAIEIVDTRQVKDPRGVRHNAAVYDVAGTVQWSVLAKLPTAHRDAIAELKKRNKHLAEENMLLMKELAQLKAAIRARAGADG